MRYPATLLALAVLSLGGCGTDHNTVASLSADGGDDGMPAERSGGVPGGSSGGTSSGSAAGGTPATGGTPGGTVPTGGGASASGGTQATGTAGAFSCGAT